MKDDATLKILKVEDRVRIEFLPINGPMEAEDLDNTGRVIGFFTDEGKLASIEFEPEER